MRSICAIEVQMLDKIVQQVNRRFWDKTRKSIING